MCGYCVCVCVCVCARARARAFVAGATHCTECSTSSSGSGSHCTNSVLYGGMRYATLDATSQDSRAEGCQDSYLPLPPGWHIATQDSDAIAVTAAHPWGTHLLVYADGAQRYTSSDDYLPSAGMTTTWYCCSDGLTALGTSSDGARYKVNACARRILIRAPPSMCTLDPCVACPGGKYIPRVLGATSVSECTHCEPGSTTSPTLSCVKCAKSSYSSAGSSVCSSCPDNMEPNEGSESCQCNAGHTLSSGSCRSTPQP